MAIAVVGVTATLVTACGAQTESETSESTTSASSPSVAGTAQSTPAVSTQVPQAPAGEAAVPAQLQFTATTLGGEQFSGESLFGQPAVLWFWAPWCPTCQREAPLVGQVAADNPGVRFVGVAGLAELPAMQEFVDRYPVQDFTQLADTDGAVWTKFGVTQQPAWAFVDAAGNVDVVRGTLPESELTERITALSQA